MLHEVHVPDVVDASDSTQVHLQTPLWVIENVHKEDKLLRVERDLVGDGSECIGQALPVKGDHVFILAHLLREVSVLLLEPADELEYVTFAQSFCLSWSIWHQVHKVTFEVADVRQDKLWGPNEGTSAYLFVAEARCVALARAILQLTCLHLKIELLV